MCFTAVSRVDKHGKNQHPVANYKVSNGSTRETCEIGSKLTIETPGQRYWHLSGMLIVNFEHISFLVLVFVMLTMNK